jgi:hypothetical protein
LWGARRWLLPGSGEHATTACGGPGAGTRQAARSGRRRAPAPQVLLPLRFLVTTAHFIAMMTVLFDTVRGGQAAEKSM